MVGEMVGRGRVGRSDVEWVHGFSFRCVLWFDPLGAAGRVTAFPRVRLRLTRGYREVRPLRGRVRGMLLPGCGSTPLGPQAGWQLFRGFACGLPAVIEWFDPFGAVCATCFCRAVVRPPWGRRPGDSFSAGSPAAYPRLQRGSTSSGPCARQASAGRGQSCCLRRGLRGNQPLRTRSFCSKSSLMLHSEEKPTMPHRALQNRSGTKRAPMAPATPTSRKIHQGRVPK